MSKEEVGREQEESRHEFDSVYANNTLMEPSLWDLKIIFGQLEQYGGKPNVDWHTAVTMPWIQAKILSYYLLANLAVHERASGTVNIPATVLPPEPEPPSGEFENNPDAQAVYEILTRVHSQIFG